MPHRFGQRNFPGQPSPGLALSQCCGDRRPQRFGIEARGMIKQPVASRILSEFLGGGGGKGSAATVCRHGGDPCRQYVAAATKRFLQLTFSRVLNQSTTANQ